MKDVAFIGLGVMGRPMAGHLLDAGHRVTTYRRGGRDDRAFREAGGAVADTIQDAVRDAEVIITMLPDTPDVESVLEGDGGVFESARSGSIVVDMSTIAPEASVRFASEGRERDIDVLDAPVSGGEAGAKGANLSIMVGGDRQVFERMFPIFEAMGSTIRLLGPSGSGQTVKAANQLIVAGNIQLLAEAIVFLEASGVDASVALDVLSGGLAGSTVLERRGASMLARDFTPGFRLDLHHKDLTILTETARRVKVPLPLGSAVAQLVAAVRAGGGGDLDHTALLQMAECMAGRGGTSGRPE